MGVFPVLFVTGIYVIVSRKKKKKGFNNKWLEILIEQLWLHMSIKHFPVLKNKRIWFWYLMHVELSFKVAHLFLYSASTEKRFKNTKGGNSRETLIILHWVRQCFKHGRNFNSSSNSSLCHLWGFKTVLGGWHAVLVSCSEKKWAAEDVVVSRCQGFCLC